MEGQNNADDSAQPVGKAHILRLPPEVLLHRILLRTAPASFYWQVAPLALVCKQFNQLVTSHLYSTVTLQATGSTPEVVMKLPRKWSANDDDDDDAPGEEPDAVSIGFGRKEKLVRTLLENKHLAGCVRTWQESKRVSNNGLFSEMVKDPVALAANLTGLVKAVTSISSVVGPQIVLNPGIYPGLRVLKVKCKAELFDNWGRDGIRLNLEVLKLRIFYEYLSGDEWKSIKEQMKREGAEAAARTTNRGILGIRGLINVLLTTCPHLRSLKVVPAEWWERRAQPEVSGTAYKLVTRDDVEESRAVAAPCLRHFNLRNFEGWLLPREKVENIQQYVADLVQQNEGIKTFGWDDFSKAGFSALENLSLRPMTSFSFKNVSDGKGVIDYIEQHHVDLEELQLWGVSGVFLEDFIKCDRLLELRKLRVFKIKITEIDYEHTYSDGTERVWIYIEQYFAYIYKFLLRLPRSLTQLQVDINHGETTLPTGADDLKGIFDKWPRSLFSCFRSLNRLDLRVFTVDYCDEMPEYYPQNEFIFVRRPRLDGEPGREVIKWWLQNVWTHPDHREVYKWSSDLLGDGEEEALGDISKEVVPLDGNTEFAGKNGDDWWFADMEYERMKFVCLKTNGNCEKEARQHLRSDLSY